MAAEEIPARRLYARALGACDGMTGHESRRQRAEHPAGGLQHDALGTRHIGDDHIGSRGFAYSYQHLFHAESGHRDHYQFRATECLLERCCRSIDQAARQCTH